MRLPGLSQHSLRDPGQHVPPRLQGPSAALGTVRPLGRRPKHQASPDGRLASSAVSPRRPAMGLPLCLPCSPLLKCTLIKGRFQAWGRGRVPRLAGTPSQAVPRGHPRSLAAGESPLLGGARQAGGPRLRWGCAGALLPTLSLLTTEATEGAPRPVWPWPFPPAPRACGCFGGKRPQET